MQCPLRAPPNITGGRHKKTKHQVAVCAKGASRQNNAEDSHLMPAKDLSKRDLIWTTGIASAERNRKMSTSKPVCARPVNLANKTWQRSMPHCLPCRIGGRPHWSRDKPGWNSTRPKQKENPKEGCTSARSCGNRPEMQISELVLWKPSWDICLKPTSLGEIDVLQFSFALPILGYKEGAHVYSSSDIKVVMAICMAVIALAYGKRSAFIRYLLKAIKPGGRSSQPLNS